jgi:hypothetical protein
VARNCNALFFWKKNVFRFLEEFHMIISSPKWIEYQAKEDDIEVEGSMVPNMKLGALLIKIYDYHINFILQICILFELLANI